ncbi:MAG: rRNA pseudouridine synthase [Phycisphaeraceae bacterium]|nr:rRNA pseudouridine synthase [Phycisphaeraceae bacterium]
MADAGVASRRDCEALIEAGRVQVNGRPVRTLPVFINPRADRVRVDGREVSLESSPRAVRESRVYIAVHKPDNTLSTTSDVESDSGERRAGDEAAGRGARRTVLDLVKAKGLPRLFPVGRLGFHDTGLVLLTNDGELANRLTHARYGVPRTYRVVVRGRVPADVLGRIARKVAASLGTDADPAAPALRPVPSESPDTTLHVTLRESPKLRIDSLLFDAGLKVKRLVRLAIGPVSLRGIVSGDWRKLSRHEVEVLLVSAGMSASAPARPTATGGAGRGSGHRAGRGSPQAARRRGGPANTPSQRMQRGRKTDQR